MSTPQHSTTRAAPVERKVTAASISAAVGGLIVWALQTYVFHGGAVPEQATWVIDLVISGAMSFVAGWVAKHTPRPPDVPPPPPPAPPAPPASGVPGPRLDGP